MRKLFCPIAFVAVFIISACDNGIDWTKYGASFEGEIRTIQFGYKTKTEGEGRGFDDNGFYSNENYVFFADQAGFDLAKEQDGYDESDSPFPDSDLGRNRFEYIENDDREFAVLAYPRGVKVKEFYIESTDPSILEIELIEDTSFKVIPHKLGDVDIKVKVVGSRNTIETVYPMRVCSIVDVEFFITPYWLRSIATRLRHKVKDIPIGIDDLVYTTKDSVTVIGYCEYYDLRESRMPYIARDTVKFPMESKAYVFKKNYKRLIRNITEGIHKIQEKTHEGYFYNDFGDIVKVDFKYVPEQVILDFGMLTTNPYVEFNYVTKYDKTFTTIDDDGHGEDNETDDDIVDDGSSAELQKSEKAYYVVTLNLFESPLERQNEMAKFQRELDEIGYDKTLSEEDKQKQMDEINKHRKGGDE